MYGMSEEDLDYGYHLILKLCDPRSGGKTRTEKELLEELEKLGINISKCRPGECKDCEYEERCPKNLQAETA